MASSLPVAKITDRLYLCGAKAIKQQPLIDTGITLVVNCSNDVPTYRIPGMQNFRIKIDDSPRVRLDMYYDRGAEEINNACSRRGRVLVHCNDGVSRSATLCIFYLMKYHHMTLADAYESVRKQRPIIRPNIGFWKQLIKLEKKLYGRNTVTIVSGVTPDVYLPKWHYFGFYFGLFHVGLDIRYSLIHVYARYSPWNTCCLELKYHHFTQRLLKCLHFATQASICTKQMLHYTFMCQHWCAVLLHIGLISIISQASSKVSSETWTCT